MSLPVSRLVAIAAACVVAACADTGAKKPVAPVAAAPKPVRAQDDFYRYVNGPWLATNEIPADRANWGGFGQLRDDAVTQLRTVVEEAEAAGSAGTADQRKIAALYESYLDETRLDALGAKPIEPQLKAIDGIRSKKELPTVIAQFNEVGIATPYTVLINQDPKDPSRYIPTIYQSGLGLPDRDYYLKDDDAKLKDTRDKYVVHVARMLTLAGVPDAEAAAANVCSSRRRSRGCNGRASRTATRSRSTTRSRSRRSTRSRRATRGSRGWPRPASPARPTR